VLARLLHLLELLEPGDRLADRREVGQGPAEPALVHVEHAAAARFLEHGLLCLLLGPDEEDRAAAGGQVAHEPVGVAELLEGFLKVDDVNAVTLAEDVLLHLRVPALGLMAEVHSGLEQLLHRQRGHASSFGLPPPRSAGARRPPPKARGVWNGELRRVLGIEPYVLLAEIAGPHAVLAPAQAEVDRDLIFRRSHDLPN